jgi:hypothetical protein
MMSGVAVIGAGNKREMSKSFKLLIKFIVAHLTCLYLFVLTAPILVKLYIDFVPQRPASDQNIIYFIDFFYIVISFVFAILTAFFISYIPLIIIHRLLTPNPTFPLAGGRSSRAILFTKVSSLVVWQNRIFDAKIRRKY